MVHLLIRSSFYLILLHLSIATVCFGQAVVSNDSTAQAFPDSLFRIDSIRVTGNEDTKEFVILREMTLKHDSLITHQGVEYDKNRIYSLGLFNRVEIEVEPISGTKANLLVHVHERWFVYPFPIFGLRDRDWNKLYYGLGLMHINFRGRNEKIFASFALGADPWVSLAYRNPFLDESGTDFLDSRIIYNKVRNRSVPLEQQFGEFDEEQFSVSTTLGKRLGIKHTLWTSIGYRVVSIPEFLVSGMPVTGGTDRFPQISVGYTYDTRDLSEYPGYGTMAAISVTKFDIPSGSVDFLHLNLDLRRYIPLGSSFVLTGRTFSVLTAGKEAPSYEHVYFGYGERVRGHFREVQEGESIVGASTELHYMILNPSYVKVGFLPKEFSLWRFAIAAAAFADAGTTWYRNEKVDLLAVPSGYGFGLHFLMPFNAVLRTEYAWNELGRSEFIFVVGASF